jgi:hypothetical protein
MELILLRRSGIQMEKLALLRERSMPYLVVEDISKMPHSMLPELQVSLLLYG